MTTDSRTGGDGVPDDVDREELYAVVREAVEDALLDALGTVVLLGIALGIVAVGASVAWSGPGFAGRAFGAGVVVAGFVVAAYALDALPFGGA